MQCPRCLAEVTGERCANCGKLLSRDQTVGSSASKQTVFPLEVTSRSGDSPSPDTDWRVEIRKKLERHQSRKDVQDDDLAAKLKARELKKRARQQIRRQQNNDRKSPEEEPPGQSSASGAPAQETSRRLFKYRLNQNENEGERRPVRMKSKREPVAKPVIRRSSTPPRRPEPNDPRQRPLELVQLSRGAVSQELPTAPGPSIPAEDLSRIEESEAGREALFSRILAGLLDLMVALLTGALFAFTGARLMSADLTSAAVMETAVACALAAWILNNAFFLFATRQTLGMMVTDLELLVEERARLTLPRVLARVLLQMLATVSVAGLLWAIFDEQGRCWHDRISRSLIVPLTQDETDDEAA